MKQPYRLICLLLCWSVNLLAQAQGKDISGEYIHKKYGTKIEIDGHNFRLIEPHVYPAVWHNDTLAKCTFKWADKHFIEINSKSPVTTALSEMSITESADSSLNDSIAIKFNIPHQGMLLIDVSDNNFKNHRFKYSLNKQTAIKLPKGIKKFGFSVGPEEIHPHTPDGSFWGVTCFCPILDFDIEKGTNLIEINLPTINDSFFEQYYVVDEYVRVENNKLYWKGEVYIKR